MRTSENVWNTLRVDAYFLKREKRISVFRNIRILVGEALLSLKHDPDKAVSNVTSLARPVRSTIESHGEK